MKAIYLNDKSMRIEIVDIKNDIDVFHKMINCRAFDMVFRMIGGKPYVIICDDEGLLNARKLTAVDIKNQEVMLVGSLIIVNNAPEGEIAGLTEDDINTIINELYRLPNGDVVINMGY